MVIYDDPRSQQAVQEILEPIGYSVTAAPCGAIAMQVLRTTMPELVIIDVSQPGRWVEEFCREIRARSTVVRLLVSSPAYDVTEVILLLQLGADDYITKPFSPSRGVPDSRENFHAPFQTVLTVSLAGRCNPPNWWQHANHCDKSKTTSVRLLIAVFFLAPMLCGANPSADPRTPE